MCIATAQPGVRVLKTSFSVKFSLGVGTKRLSQRTNWLKKWKKNVQGPQETGKKGTWVDFLEPGTQQGAVRLDSLTLCIGESSKRCGPLSYRGQRTSWNSPGLSFQLRSNKEVVAGCLTLDKLPNLCLSYCTVVW